MNSIYENQLIEAINNNQFKEVYNSTILITGASGLIGRCIIDILMKANEIENANIKVIASVRNLENAKNIFREYIDKEDVELIKYDVMERLSESIKVNYIIHAASNAHPMAFSTEPVNTLIGNVIGTKNLLDFGIKNNVKKLLYVSSGEVYGKDDGKIEAFTEEYRGYVDNLSFRSCYPIGKISAETMCTCYSKQYDINTVIVRPCHIYGPTITDKDSRVMAQFIRNALNNENIIMKSEGKQYRSYCYVVDCATGILIALAKGENVNAYNIANKDSNITIKSMAKLIANTVGTKVVFDIPSNTEKQGYNVVEKSILDATKLETLGWKPLYNMEKGIKSTIKILKINDVKR